MPRGLFETRQQWLALLCLTIVLLCIAATYPAFPVDETRYLTVAWEMRHGHWILPLLNGQPYSQKPPLLFWLINLAWCITGLNIWSARLVCFAFAVAVLVLTRQLAKALFPERPDIYNIAPLLTAASPLFMVFSNMIMFDQLLYAFVLAALLFLWQAGQARHLRPWLLLGLALGFGVLAKGPVVLVSLFGPALLAPFFWLPKNAGYSKKSWYGGVALSVVIGTAIALAWAIPSALIGGPAYAHMIFWGQSAGRMVGSFAHQEAPWFYIPFAIAYMLPWLFLGPLWRMFGKSSAGLWQTPQARFLLCWLLPAFATFSFISGKQMHYILPLLSGVAILAAFGIAQTRVTEPERPVRPWFLLFYLFGFLFMAAVPLLPFVRHNRKYQNLSHGVAYFDHWPFLLGCVIAAGAVWLARKRFSDQVLAMVFCGSLLFCTIALEGGRYLFKFYDLTPLRPVLQPYAGHPVAVVRPYEGEINFLTRLDRPPTVLGAADLPGWFAAHPDGVAVLKNRLTDPLPAAREIYEQPYHGDQRYSVLLPASK